ncbi:hypothetical protein BC629DRAFT_1509993 [Irpex lacteus]|nr:hypothetical protein BC629DRAFT_1509993 [Irpex lacteus]
MHKRWQAMSPLERSAATDDVYLKKKESALRCHSEQQSQMLAELDNISEEMGGYLDRLKEIKNTPLDEIRSMTWLREDHRLRILNRVWHLRKGGLKSHIQNLIARKLEEVIGHGPVRMAYKSFDTRITKKYGVIVENWPQLPFASANNTPEDTITLYLLWKSGATRFKRLSPEEKEIWDATREKLQMERNKVTSPNLRSLPSRAFPSHRMLLDTKLLGTIDQISEFMFPSYAPKKCPRPRDNK